LQADSDPFRLDSLSADLDSTAATATLTVPSDSKVMIRDPAQQVFLVLPYRFGAQ
jgi:hypothetical protein